MRRNFAQTLLWLCTILWGIWFGGQFFNALMIVPIFSASPPQSLTAWAPNRQTYILDFFVVFNTLWIFLGLTLSLLVGWRFHSPNRQWIIASTIAALLSVIFLLAWMVPTIGRLITPNNGLSAAESVALLHRWTIANWVRMGIELCGFVFALRALSLSSNPIPAESVAT